MSTILTPQQKIDAIYDILRKQESRRKWDRFFRWGWRAIIVSFIGFITLFPGKAMEITYTLLAPMIEETVKEMIHSETSGLIDGASSTRDALIDATQNLLNR